jgi:hypothetical protein
MCRLVCPGIHYITTIIKKIWSLRCVLLNALQLLSEIFPILRPTEHYVINVHSLHVKCQFYWSNVNYL